MSSARARREAPKAADAAVETAMPASVGALAVRIVRWAEEAGDDGLIHIADNQRRATALAKAARGLAPDLDVVLFPPWDCLPYDRASPSADIMGQRMAALRVLARRKGACLVVAVAEAVAQRVPPREVVAKAGLRLGVGDLLAEDGGEGFETRLEDLGYRRDERVDEAGEFALRGQVLDVFGAAAVRPRRLDLADGRIETIQAFDPVSQLTVGEPENAIWIDPASEIVGSGVTEAAGPDEDDPEHAEPERDFGAEHWLPRFYSRLETLFDVRPSARVVLEPEAEARALAGLSLVAEAFASRRTLRATRQPAGARQPLPPARLYLEAAELSEILARPGILRLEPAPADPGDQDAVPRFAAEPNPVRAFASFLRRVAEEGRRVVLAAAGEANLKRLSRRAEPALGKATAPAPDWAAVLDAPEGAMLTMRLELPAGFMGDGVAVVTAGDLFGSDPSPEETSAPLEAALLLESELRAGDVVVHLDYGFGVLGGLETVPAGDGETGEAVRVTYKGDSKLLVPVGDLDRVWRYGSDPDAVTLDRLDGEAWPKRRAAIEAEIAQAAAALAEDAKRRKAARAERLEWPRRDYERFSAGFAFTETPDQARAIEAVLADLASGRPMNRLVCGDVGYGKTEVALRAAAVAALAGKQVAVVAPTTVLVRQHLNTFARRFRAVGIEMAHLSRLTTAAEAKRVKQGLKDGTIRVVVGTHALISKTVRFKDLGLVVIDEEQRFGRAHKEKLRELAKGVNLLTLTATPIPQTLQAAMVGLQELSLIATPPARRRPIRTFVAGFDPATAREALLREKRRGGQSFVVCPRIEDIAPMAARLAELAPELDVLVAHGKLPAAEIDDAMVRFAEGDGDVLLATNIIESGLDVPRANTMLVWRADRFGLAQLHQLRGRVGRGRRQAFAYLLTAPDARIGAQTRNRLATLETLDRLGAGFAISARDLDLRGAGDLLGEEQAGHVKLIGAGLYQHLLEQALRGSDGDALPEPPTLNIEAAGRIPDDYVPEADTRINLYARLARIADPQGLDGLREEFEDRFGPIPEPVETLLATARLKALCRRLYITRVDAGPKAIALTFGPQAEGNEAIRAALDAPDSGVTFREGRAILANPAEAPAARLDDLIARLESWVA